jgi:general secretion pathway protein D
VKQENDQEKPLAVSINIVRVDLKDDYKAGVDWNAVWNKGLFGLRDLKISSSMAGLVNGGFSVSGAFKGTDQILSMLQEYGKTKIERSRTIEIRSGYLASFEAVKPIPYISQTSTITGGTTGFSQGSITPLSEEEGVVLNILPNINIEENFVDMGIDVTVAEYTGDKQFDLGTQGIYTLPIVPKDKAKFAARARIGDTVILTGFKVHKSGNNRKGIPGFSQVPVAGSLFGYQDDTDETSEILIIMKVEKGV